MARNSGIGRQRAAIGMGRAASSAEARLIHNEMARRYRFQAEVGPPFMLPGSGPATEGERAALHLADRSQPRRRGELGEPGTPAATRR
jgi:hypothetical protein